MEELENIALFDMDGTLCDHNKAIYDGLEKLRSPGEPVYRPPIGKDVPKYIWNRIDLIRAPEIWWETLPRFQLGWDILGVADELDYRIMILTQGSKRNPSVWSGKKKWMDNNIGQDIDITITRDKGLVYGKVLVDDYPPYIERWLKWRKNGLVIMPANELNQAYTHPNLVRYDGTNLSAVTRAMVIAKKRQPEEPLIL